MNEIEVPKAMKLTMLFIDRIGFPSMAFLLMAYMCFVTLEKVTTALMDLSKVMTLMSAAASEHDRAMRSLLKNIGATDD